MEFIFEIVLQFLGEILLQMVVELLVELGFHSLADTAKKPKNPVLSTIGFVLWGSMAGGLSLWIFPHSSISNPRLRALNLVIAPIVAGILMTLIGRFRDRRGQDLVSLDRFGYAFVFALSMSLVRFLWAS
ncbi:hypothetical protein PMI04_011605 [Sphingobium sp. AP49]|uniref:hypothetical protein n=1 Tax=Sphingobium sp. AP49 TaxID=1144307 RepID=UPI00026ED502|nr:hypothetical protein [Sphingobium sp. AP49]WHO37218.1 hypothetical protein PMI04_011605 [Sphingobium sp. AP49]